MKLLTPEIVAEQLSVSRSTVLRLIQDGSLPAVILKAAKRKKIYRVRPEALEKWVIGREKKTPTKPIFSGHVSADASPTNGKAIACEANANGELVE
jgi:excisionase family DNA binding protein